MRILIADVKPSARAALRLYIARGWLAAATHTRDGAPSPLATIVEAASVAEVVQCVGEGEIDIALVDWSLPLEGGAAAVRMVRQMAPEARIVVLAGDPRVERDALGAGADTFVSKGSPPEALGAALAGHAH